MVKSLGANHAIDYTQEDFTKNGQTYDIIYDTVGKISFATCRDSLTEEGVYLTNVPTPGIMLRALWPAKSGLKARFLAAGMRPAHEKVKDLVFMREVIESGGYKAVIDRSYPLEEMADAHRYVEKGHKKGNVVIRIN
jgi:NADPH:quinone reductase-like Zn-dependent oxidoreductase